MTDRKIKMEEKKKSNKKKSNKKKKLLFPCLLLIFAIAWFWSWIPVTEHISLDLPAVKDTKLCIVLISDLHSCRYGSGQRDLLERIDREEPDLIMIGGDFFDDKLSDDNAKITAKALAGKYPCYYVTGNHEFWSGHVDEIKAYLENIGVRVLAGTCETVTVKGCTIDICGVDDPTEIGLSQWRTQLDAAYSLTDQSHLRLLLSHRPELVNEYLRYDFDLIMSGHAHAGQIRIPFVNKGVFAPDQGLMAEYVNGVYQLSNGSILEVSRGLARESTPAPRFFNHPEVVVLDLE